MSSSYPKSTAGRPTTSSELLGQVFTPTPIAYDMAKQLLVGNEKPRVSILDPCVGPATFPQAIEQGWRNHFDAHWTLIDVDPAMADLARRWSMQSAWNCDVVCEDYLLHRFEHAFDYAILNPPYVRQEWIDRKHDYQQIFRQEYGISIPGTSNLYVYFLVKTVIDLKPGGTFVAIIYDSWQYTLFGQWLKQFLLTFCQDVSVANIKDQPFKDRLIDATIVMASKRLDPVIMMKPLPPSQEMSPQIEGFIALGELYNPKRGLRLKQSKFFLCDFHQFESMGATPFIKKSGSIKGYRVPDDHNEGALLCESKNDHPLIVDELYRRLEIAKQSPQANVSVLTWYHERAEDWYLHSAPPFAPIIFNYYLRKRPRHLYNPNRAYSDNFYGIEMTPTISPLASLAILNSTIVCRNILARARNQGNGLSKIQLFEYRTVSIPDLRLLSPNHLMKFEDLGLKLITSPSDATILLGQIDRLIYELYRHPILKFHY